MKRLSVAILFLIGLMGSTSAQRVMEKLDRGLLVVDLGSNVFVSWRMHGTDPDNVTYDLYRNDTKVNTSPVSTSTNYSFSPSGKSSSDTYKVIAVVDNQPIDTSEVVNPWSNSYLKIPLTPPAGGTTPDNVEYTYEANDASVGDLDNDGQYEIVLKWYPTNAKDNANAGYTGNTILEGLEMDGTSLWRIDLGRNIRSGSHYTQFMVYDLDSDGRAEIACKTADGTVDGAGVVIGDADADYRNTSGRILTGPEYFTVFDGQTGAALATTDYHPQRGNVAAWGDGWGNRVDRFLACVAYLDGQRPSVVMCRGYYTRAVLAAYDYRGGELSIRWIFDTDNGYPDYMGQGAHSISVGDADGDGKDEIMYGAAAIDDDGTGLYTTGMGHGDATHLADIDPDEGGLEFFMPHESSRGTADRPNISIRNAGTGEMQWIDRGSGGDIGRGITMDIDPNHRGYEVWASDGRGVYDKDGNVISTTYPQSTSGGNTPSYNFGIWWNADLQRDILDRGVINSWNPSTSGSNRLKSLYQTESTSTNNGTKSTPCLSGDLLGDWREEVLMRRSDNTALILFVNTEVTTHRMRTLMHDSQYRLAIAWQNVGYNQPPHPSFYLGHGMDAPVQPDIVYPGSCLDDLTPLPFGEHTSADLSGMGISLSDITNLDLPKGSTLLLFDQDDFEGTSTSVRGTGSCAVTQPSGNFSSAMLISQTLSPDLTYIIKSKVNDKLVTAKDAAKAPGTPIVVTDDQISNSVGGTNQVWAFKKEVGKYLFWGFQSRSYIEADASSNVVLGDFLSELGESNQFEIALNVSDDRYFSIKSVTKDQCWTLNPADGTLSLMACDENNENQQFYEEVRPAERVCQTVAHGRYQESELEGAGLDLSDIRDLDIPEETSFILFEEDGFQGAYNIIRGSACGTLSQPAGEYSSAIYLPEILGEDIHYVLKSRYLGRVITADVENWAAGTPVLLDDDAEGGNDFNGANQTWTLEKTTNGTFHIRSRMNNRLLEVNTEEVLVQGPQTATGDSQEFEILVADDPFKFALKNKATGKCVSGTRDDLACVECNLSDNKQLFSEIIRWSDWVLPIEPSGNLKTLIYPNPVKGQLIIDDENAKAVQLFSLSGELVIQKELNGTSALDLSSLRKGTYILRLKTGKEHVTLKVFTE